MNAPICFPAHSVSPYPTHTHISTEDAQEQTIFIQVEEHTCLKRKLKYLKHFNLKEKIGCKRNVTCKQNKKKNNKIKQAISPVHSIQSLSLNHNNPFLQY